MDTQRPLKHPQWITALQAHGAKSEWRSKNKRKEERSVAGGNKAALRFTVDLNFQTPQHSTAREERRAHSLGETRGRGGGVQSQPEHFFFFLKEKPDGLHDDWVNLTENEGWSSATMRRWVTLLLWAPSCSNAQNWKAEQLLSENSSAVRMNSVFTSTYFVMFVDSEIKEMWRKIRNYTKDWIHPSSVSVKKKKKVILTLRPGKPLMPVPPTGPCEAPQKHTLSIKDTDGITHPPVSQATTEKPCVSFSLDTVCETAGLDDGGEPTVPAWKDLK